jgi:hypothetical protein
MAVLDENGGAGTAEFVALLDEVVNDGAIN